MLTEVQAARQKALVVWALTGVVAATIFALGSWDVLSKLDDMSIAKIDLKFDHPETDPWIRRSDQIEALKFLVAPVAIAIMVGFVWMAGVIGSCMHSADDTMNPIAYRTSLTSELPLGLVAIVAFGMLAALMSAIHLTQLMIVPVIIYARYIRESTLAIGRP